MKTTLKQLQIRPISNVRYTLTNAGIEIVHKNGQPELLIANNTLLDSFKKHGLSLSSDGKVIEEGTDENKNKKEHITTDKKVQAKVSKEQKKPAKKARKAKSTAKSTKATKPKRTTSTK